MDPKTGNELWRRSLASLATHLQQVATDSLTQEMSAGVRNEVYLLIQLAMQSGPLRGSDPGYFKRATTTVEHIEPAVGFLQVVVPHLEALVLSANQTERVTKWLADGEKQLTKKQKS